MTHSQFNSLSIGDAVVFPPTLSTQVVAAYFKVAPDTVDVTFMIDVEINLGMGEFLHVPNLTYQDVTEIGATLPVVAQTV